MFLCIICRQLDGQITYVTVMNVGPSLETVNLAELFTLPDQLLYHIVGISSHHVVG